MGIDLSKGARIDLSKEAPGLTKVRIGLGWDTNATDTGGEFDLDASVFMIDANGKVPAEKFFVYYNNKTSEDSSVEHHGDNLTGAGDGDDEVVDVDLSKVNEKITEITFIVTIHEAESRRQNFGQVSNSFIRLLDGDNEIAKYELDEDFSTETAIEFGKLYKKSGSWRFQAVGTGYNSGLQSFVDKYIG
ncbi:putative stress response protein, TerZ- and CABP1 [Thiovulum sp. ES]|nr:putative stress response protein, TerZ- and CABP1 [Thiovulum sp. ES]